MRRHRVQRGARARAGTCARASARHSARPSAGPSAGTSTGKGARTSTGAAPGGAALIKPMAYARFRASLLKRGTALCWGRGAGARFGIAADAPTLVIFLSDSLSFFNSSCFSASS